MAYPTAIFFKKGILKLLNIPILRDYYIEKEYLYAKKTCTIQPGLTVLTGCNGIGKTTLLHQIKKYCEENKIPCFSFDNLTNGGSNARSKAGFYGDVNFLATAMCSSEGENINMNIGKCACSIGKLVKTNENAKQIVILMDAIDSGLSVDYIIEVKEYLFKTIINDCKNRNIDVYIIVSANEYEMARGENCLTLPSLSYRQFKTYDSYRKFIIRTRNNKNKRYGDEPFEFA